MSLPLVVAEVASVLGLVVEGVAALEERRQQEERK
jgi:hypothetical protein